MCLPTIDKVQRHLYCITAHVACVSRVCVVQLLHEGVVCSQLHACCTGRVQVLPGCLYVGHKLWQLHGKAYDVLIQQFKSTFT